MLVLSRFRDEVICIGDDIRILVVDIRGDKVLLVALLGDGEQAGVRQAS